MTTLATVLAVASMGSMWNSAPERREWLQQNLAALLPWQQKDLKSSGTESIRSAASVPKKPQGKCAVLGWKKFRSMPAKRESKKVSIVAAIPAGAAASSDSTKSQLAEPASSYYLHMTFLFLIELTVLLAGFSIWQNSSSKRPETEPTSFRSIKRSREALPPVPEEEEMTLSTVLEEDEELEEIEGAKAQEPSIETPAQVQSQRSRESFATMGLDLGEVPSPARAPGSPLPDAGSSVREEEDPEEQSTNQVGSTEEEALDEDQELEGEAAVGHARSLMENCTWVKDPGQFVIFEEEGDELAFHKRRSKALSVFLSAFRWTFEAGCALEDEVERLMKEESRLVGEAAYWRSKAEVPEPEEDPMDMDIPGPIQEDPQALQAADLDEHRPQVAG